MILGCLLLSDYSLILKGPLRSDYGLFQARRQVRL